MKSDPLAAARTLSGMNPLADPFSKVHPLFWPVLWLSLRAFVAWTGKLIEAGHGWASMRVEITWYGWIHVVYLDLSPQRAAFNRHMHGVEEEGWRGVLAKAGREMEGLLIGESSPVHGGGWRQSRSEGGSLWHARHGLVISMSPPAILDTS